MEIPYLERLVVTLTCPAVLLRHRVYCKMEAAHAGSYRVDWWTCTLETGQTTTVPTSWVLGPGPDAS